MKRQQGFDAIVERENGLHRALSTGQLSMIAIGGAIGTGLFLGSAFAIGFAGPSVLLSYAVGALIALLLMGCLAEMTVAHPTSGSFGAYAEYYINPLAGFLVRYAYWCSIVLAIGTEVTAIAIYMKYWFPSLPGWYWIVGFSVALIGVNLVSVKVFGAVEYVFSMIKIAAILLFILLGAYVVFTAPLASGIGFSNYSSHGGFFPKGVWGMWEAVIVSIFSYVGIEMIAVAAGEACDPRKSIARAFRGTMFRLAFFYLLTLALMLAIVPWNVAGTDESPFVRVMEATHLAGAAWAMNAVILVAALSAMNGQLYIATRMMFSLSRAGFAPRRLGRLSSRGVPTAALFLSSIGIALATVLYINYPDASFTLMMSVSMFGAMFTWSMIFVTHLFFRKQHSGKPLQFKMWGFPATSLLGAALMIGTMVTTYFTREFKMTMVCGVPFILSLSIVYIVCYRKPINRENCIVYDERAE